MMYIVAGTNNNKILTQGQWSAVKKVLVFNQQSTAERSEL